MWVILAGGIMISLLGMADDLWDLPSYQEILFGK